MALTLYGMAASPFVQRVLMAARMKGYELPLSRPPDGDLKSPAFLALSPLGRVPALDHDGFSLCESGAILSYLDDLLDGPGLYPADLRAKARVRIIEELAAAELAGLRPVMMGIVFRMPVSRQVSEAGLAQVDNGLAAIEARRDPAHAFAAGDTPTAADCLLLPLLTLMEVIDGSVGTLALIERRPGLAAYRARMDDHPVVGRSAREMREGFAAIMARRVAQGTAVPA